jgi:hypothetical protein
MQPLSALGFTSRLSSRRQVLAGAGGVAVCLAGFGKAALADMLVDHRSPQVTAATFTPFVDGYFKVYNDGSPMPTLKLVKVLQQARGSRPTGLRDPFSLILARMDGLVLAPDVHRVQLPDQRWVEMFLSPISPDSSRYEAAFT